MIEKIVKMISNLKILSKMNEVIDGLNTHTANKNNPHNVTAEQLGLATAYVYKGSVTNFSDLPTDAQNGWVYSVENEHTDSAGILHPAGANFAWNGSKWDDLGGSLSGYTKSVNSQPSDNKGNVNLTLVESLEKNTEDKLVVHNSDGSIQELEIGKTYSAGTGISLSGTTFSNSGVRSVKAGSTANVIVVDTNGTSVNITINNVANATNATKATQDSAGQQINTTYIKALSVSGKTITYTKGNGSTGTITTQDTVYTHPTSAGNKHIPSGGSSGQILRWSADGTAVWGADNNPTYSTATQSANGLMSASDKKKLDGIASGANAYSLPTATGSVLGGVKVGSGLSISSGILSSVNAIASNYIRYQSGLQICWGNIEITGDNNSTSTITLPVAFKDTNYSVTGTGSFSTLVDDLSFGLVTIPKITTSNFTCKKLFSEKSTFRWVAIGYWK